MCNIYKYIITEYDDIQHYYLLGTIIGNLSPSLIAVKMVICCSSTIV